MLISNANLISLTDLLGKIWDVQKAAVGTGSADSKMADFAGDALTLVLGLADYDQLHDLLEGAYNTQQATATATLVKAAAQQLQSAIEAHCTNAGASVDASINGLAGYLAYYNRTAGADYASKWNAMMSPSFKEFWDALAGTTLPIAEVFAAVAAGEANAPGMGNLTYGTPDVFAAGILDYTAKGSVDAKLRVSTQITTASNPLTIVVTGKNHAGVTATWQASFEGGETIAPNTEANLEPVSPDVTSRLVKVTGMALAEGSSWGAGVVYVKPVQKRTP